jgi:two-component system response regulator FixJ
MSSQSYPVFIVEDDVVARFSLSATLQTAGMHTVAFETPEALLEAGADLASPCCIVCDVNLPGMDGLAFHQLLTHNGFSPPVVFISGVSSVDTAVAAVKAGAFDFLTKPADPQRLISVVKAALDKAISDGNLRINADKLSNREREIFLLIADGLQSKDIAEQLGLSARTVDVHRSHIYKKLGIKNVTEAVRLADRLR